MRRYGRLGYWRGGLPVERGSFPGTLEWRPVRDRTDNLELFMGWVQDIEAVLATVGLSMVSTQRGDGSVEWMAAGHKVAELRKPFGSGRIEGTVYARPAGGPGPGVRGAVAAEELRRSSQWLGYRGYGQREHPVVTAEELTGEEAEAIAGGESRFTVGGKRTKIRTADDTGVTIQKAVQVEIVRAEVEESGALDTFSDASAEADAIEAEAKPLVVGGGVLAALGVAGGIATALLGGKMSAAAMIASGVGSAGGSAGGITLIVKGKRRLAEANRLRGLAGGKMQTPADVATITSYVDPAGFYNAMMKPHESISVEAQVFAKDSPAFVMSLMKEGFDPGPALLCDYSGIDRPGGDEWHDAGRWIDLASRTNCRDWRGPLVHPAEGNNRLLAAQVQRMAKECGSSFVPANLTNDCLKAYMTGNLPPDVVTPGRAQGLTIIDPLIDSSGKPLWATVSAIRSKTAQVTVRSPGGERSVSGKQNDMVLLDAYGEVIANVRHHRYMDENNLGWWRGGWDNSQRGCSGCLDDLAKSDPNNRVAWIKWGANYSNFEGRGGPPLGFLIRGDNPWLGPVMSSGGERENPTATLADDTSYPAELRGPMSAIVQLYRALRAANPEVSSMYFPTVDDIFHATVGAAKVEDHRAWWYSVGDYCGTILGIAAMCCEVAAPIISTVNPAAGAVIGGTISNLIRGVGGVVENVKDRNIEGSIGGVLDVMRSLGWTSTDLQGKLAEGYSKVKDLYSEAEQMVEGWADMKGLFVPEAMALYKEMGGLVTDVLDPAQQLAWFNRTVMKGASEGILAYINMRPSSAFYMRQINAYSIIPEKLGLENFPVTDIVEAYKDNKQYF